ncbi:hypothetical protein D3C80_1600660 [compost metagenome]
MVEVGKSEWVAKEKDRGVITNEIPIPLFSIKLDCKAANVTLRIGRTTFSGNSREPNKDWCLFPNFCENRCLGVFSNICCDFKGAVRARPFCMHPALRDDLAIKVS